MAAEAQKTSWADDDDVDVPRPPKAQESVDENGIITITEIRVNENGKKVKITKKIRRTVQKSVVEHAVAEHRSWAKFGKEKGNKPGPDLATTQIQDNVMLKITAGNKNEPEPSEQDTIRASLLKAGASTVKCRLCGGEHYTARCPHKDSLAGLDSLNAPPADDDYGTGDAAAASTTVGGKYVPPSMRAGGGRAGESMGRPGGNRDDLPTLRVTNVSEDTTDNDLRDLFSRFGRVARVYIGRDRETGAAKGYAFVSFEMRSDAEEAMRKVHGMGYDNLILNCQWSQPREQR